LVLRKTKLDGKKMQEKMNERKMTDWRERERENDDDNPTGKPLISTRWVAYNPFYTVSPDSIVEPPENFCAGSHGKMHFYEN